MGKNTCGRLELLTSIYTWLSVCNCLSFTFRLRDLPYLLKAMIKPCTMKVSKDAKIRNRYNQVPHLTQDTNGKVTNSLLDTTNESQEVSLFPAGDHKAHKNTYKMYNETCRKGPLKILKTNGSLMKVESISECSPWSVLQYF